VHLLPHLPSLLRTVEVFLGDIVFKLIEVALELGFVTMAFILIFLTFPHVFELHLRLVDLFESFVHVASFQDIAIFFLLLLSTFVDIDHRPKIHSIVRVKAFDLLSVRLKTALFRLGCLCLDRMGEHLVVIWELR